MLYQYKVTTKDGRLEEGDIDSPNIDSAISSLQQRGLIVVYINPAKEKGGLFGRMRFFDRVTTRNVVILSRQLATLFEAKVAVLNIFKLLAAESDNFLLREKLAEMTDDIQSGTSISNSMARHPEVFSSFYVSMVRSGEESGKLSETFTYLADHLERSYELYSKARNALLYPAFVIVSFIGVMILMLVVIIPKLTTILKETGQELPIYTKIVVGVSDFLVKYGIFLAMFVIVAALFAWRYSLSKIGRMAFSRLKLSIPFIGNLYRKLYLSRVADNMDTMLSSGISMLRAIEITADVVGNEVYREILMESLDAVKGGASLSDSLARFDDVPRILVQMTRIGEETGKLGYVLKTISRFYKREVDAAVDNIVSLIEPVMIVLLGLGVGFLLIAVLGPIYNITGNI